MSYPQPPPNAYYGSPQGGPPMQNYYAPQGGPPMQNYYGQPQPGYAPQPMMEMGKHHHHDQNRGVPQIPSAVYQDHAKSSPTPQYTYEPPQRMSPQLQQRQPEPSEAEPLHLRGDICRV
ncbi:hypothetical protein RHOSPDRAFT_36481 [Rhodotorula sp. JG-1b]|nr:hypothetical protein RHOSPDRAFT_36481 [Rhodotorula sp. JG-1b]